MQKDPLEEFLISEIDFIIVFGGEPILGRPPSDMIPSLQVCSLSLGDTLL